LQFVFSALLLPSFRPRGSPLSIAILAGRFEATKAGASDDDIIKQAAGSSPAGVHKLRHIWLGVIRGGGTDPSTAIDRFSSSGPGQSGPQAGLWSDRMIRIFKDEALLHI
jgi:hypothetical protein